MYVWDVQNVKRVGKNASYLFHSSKINGLEVVIPDPLLQSKAHNFDPSHQPREGLNAVLPPAVGLPVGTFLTCSEVGLTLIEPPKPPNPLNLLKPRGD